MYKYNRISNYLSKAKVPYETKEICIERKIVISRPKAPTRKIIPVIRKIALNEAYDYEHDLSYWLKKSPEERLAAVTFLIRQSIQKDQRMDKTKRKLKS